MFKRHAPRLAPTDLSRFGRDFKKNLEALLPGRRVRLVPLSDWPSPECGPEDESLVMPLSYRGRELGFLIISPGEPGIELLEEMVRQALENMWLRKALLTDRETGLYSRDYFSRHFLKSLRKHRRRGTARSLSLDEESSPDLFLIMVELREAPEPGPALAALAERLAGHFPGRPARLASRRLALLAGGRPEDVRNTLDSALDEQLAAEPSSRPVAAWVRYPHDLGGPASNGDKARLRAQARLLWEKAEVTLFYARQSRASTLALAFADLIEHHGQVVQILPQGRVVINLGRETGAAAGQVYLVAPPEVRPSAEPEYKGEITIYETGDSYSLAHVSGLKPSRGLVAGDRLTFSRRDYQAENSDNLKRPVPAGFLGQLPDGEKFLSGLERIKDQALSLALFRLDGYEKTLSLTGAEEGERLLTFVFDKIIRELPETELKTLWRGDCLALAWPGGDRSALEEKARNLVAELRESGPVSAGLLFSPGGSESVERLMEDGRKALLEAAYSGPGQLAVFGPLSLNISGDRLFEDGDLAAAIEEYERGLSLAADDLNLLNSLGVCQGRLGDLGRALETFEKISLLDPENMMAHYNLGYTHLLAGRLVEAEEALTKAAELAPDNFESLFHLGKTALELGHLDKALAALKEAARLENARPVVFRLLGEALLLANERQAALAAFKKAVKNAPNDAYALSALGALFVDLANDLEPARSLFQRSVEIDPTNCLYRQRLGRLLFSLGDYDEAEHHLNMAVEYGSRSPEVHYHLGRLAEEHGREGEARQHFRAALDHDPAYQPALERVAQ